MTSEENTSVPAPTRRRVDLSATQVLASALAAITATVAASYLGVSGTVIGAAVASVLTVTGNAVYTHSLRTTGARVRATAGRPARAVHPRADDALPVLPDRERRPASPVWRRLAFGTVAVFTTVLTVVTGIELVAGRPISDLVRGQSGSGTTLFDGNQPARKSTPQPRPVTVTQTVTPSVVVITPTVTQTAPPVTRTVTPTQTQTTPTSPSAPTTTTPTTATGGGTGTSEPTGAAPRG
jgi:hypothetical protein